MPEHDSIGNGAETAVQAQNTDGAFNVVLRLANGERVEAGIFGAEHQAHAFAEEFIDATHGPKWPRVGDRYLRPETILSVDVEQNDQPRWTGSTGRASSWTGRGQ